jgi:DNA polymerase III delta subunit
MEDIEKNLQSMREYATWELTSAIGTRNGQQAIKVLGRLLDEGKHPLQIIATLQIQLRQLIIIKSMLSKRMPPQEIARAAGIRFFVERTIAQARGFRPQELLDAYKQLFYLENSFKSAGIDERFLLEKYILEMCQS